MSFFDETAFSRWLFSKQSLLDEVCAEGMRDGLAGLNSMELAAANASVCSLYTENGCRDCDYALKGVGTLYTGHWHGKRVHDALSILMPLQEHFSQGQLNIIDAGAGTGAVLWAWALIACFAREIGASLPVHSWTSIDQSADMLAQGDRLWSGFCRVFPEASRVVDRSNPINADWRQATAIPAHPFVVGSYMFSTKDSNASNARAIFGDSPFDQDPIDKMVGAFVRKNRARAIVTWTSSGKAVVLDEIRNAIKDWANGTPHRQFDCPLQGQMPACVKIANDAFSGHGLECAVGPQQFNWGTAPTRARVLAMFNPSR